MILKKLIFFYLLIILVKTSNNRKLSNLFFGNKIFNNTKFNDCPPKHQQTNVQDLCLYIYKLKKTHKNAEEFCNKASHHLAVVDSDQTWLAIESTLKDFKSTTDIKNNRFHMGTIYKHGFDMIYWNFTNSRIDSKYLCKLRSSISQSNYKNSLNNDNLNLNCIELIENDRNFESRDGSSLCLKLINCLNVRYAICEWRGSSIKNFFDQLSDQLLNAYITTFCVASLFCLMWIFLYFLHWFRFKDLFKSVELNHLIETKNFKTIFQKIK